MKSKKRDIEKITTKPQIQPGTYYMVFIGILLFIFFFLCLFIIFFGKFDPILLFLSIISLILGILVFMKIPKRYKQISIDRTGVRLIRRNKKYIVPFKDVENLAPQIKIDRSWWNFSKYSGITVRKKGEKDRFIVADADEVDTVYFSYLNNAPDAIVKERKRIPLELNKFHHLVQNSNIIKDWISVLCILLSMILAILFVPDLNLRGELFSWQMKMIFGFIMGLLIVGALIIFFGMFFGTEFNAKIMAFKWRVNNLNEILEQNNQEIFYVDESSLDSIEKVTKTSLRNTGILLIIMGLIIPLIAFYSIISSGLSSSMIFPIIFGPSIALFGYTLFQRSKSSPN